MKKIYKKKQAYTFFICVLFDCDFGQN